MESSSSPTHLSTCVIFSMYRARMCSHSRSVMRPSMGVHGASTSGLRRIRDRRAGFALPHGFRVPRFVRIKGVHPEQEGAGLVAAVGQPVLGIRHDAGNIAVFGLAELLLAQEAADFVEELRAVVVDDFAFFH